MTPFGTLYTISRMVYPRSTTIFVLAKLNGLDIQTDPNFQFGVTNKSPEYLAKFPHGKVPALEMPSGFLLAESTAIAYYVADSGPKREQLLGRTPEEKALVQMWTSLADTEIGPASTAITRTMLGYLPYSKASFDAHQEEFDRSMAVLEQQLAREGKVWLVRDDEPSVADFTILSKIFWPLCIFLDPEYRAQFPKVMAWYERLMEIEAVAEVFNAPAKLAEKRPADDGSEAKSIQLPMARQ